MISEIFVFILNLASLWTHEVTQTMKKTFLYFDKVKSNYISCSWLHVCEFNNFTRTYFLNDYKTAIMFTEWNFNFSRKQVVSVAKRKRDFNLNWPINLLCQCARLMPTVDTSKIVWWCTVHYKDNWHFNVQSIITATYVFNFPRIERGRY